MEKLFKEKRKRRAKMGWLLSAAAFVLISLAGAGKITGKAADAVFYRTCTVNADNSLSYETKSITDYTAVDSNTTAWNTGWYVVNGNITISSRITVSGDVKCILLDGCQLTASSGITLKEGNSLTVYGSVNGTGELKATGNSATAVGIGDSDEGGSAGSLTVYGGTVTAAGSDSEISSGGVGIGGGANTGGNGGSVTVYGGTVTAAGGGSEASPGGVGIGGGANTGGNGGNGGSVIVYGGTVTAAGGNSEAGFGGAGIGGGGGGNGNGGNGGSVIVYGGTVTAAGGNSEAGFGGVGIGGGGGGNGNGGNGGSLTVYGGTVTAQGGQEGNSVAAAIGAGIGPGFSAGTAIDFQSGTIIQNGGVTHMLYVVAVTLGEHMTSGDALSQTITGNNTVDITVQASEGYYFPADYISEISGATGGKINNLTITRKSDTTVTITGRPNANTRITLPAAAERTYTLSVTAPVFDFVTYGYTRPDAKPVTVASSGNTGTAITGAAISGADADAFELNTTQGTVIAAGSTDSTTYTIQPKSGLDAGEYSAAITVTYQNGTETAAAAGDVFFKVEPAAIPETPAPAETEETAAVPETEPRPAVTAEEAQSAREGLNQQVQAGATYNRLRWARVKGADGYIIYGSKCSSAEKKHKMKELKTITSGRKTSWTHKDLKKNTWYKYQIAAYKLVNGKQVEIGSSVSLHSLTQGDSRYANPVRVKVSKTKITLKKGRSTVIKAEAVLPKGKKTEHHTEEIRYVVSDPEIVSVSKKGKIKGKKKGSCTVYAVAQNGVYEKIKVKVK